MPGINPTNDNRQLLAPSDAFGIETHETGAAEGEAKKGATTKPRMKPKDRIDYGDVGRPSYLDLVRPPPKQGDIRGKTVDVGPLDTSLGPAKESTTQPRPGRGESDEPRAKARRPETRARLSKAELAERQRVATLDRGVGFAHGSAKLDKAAARAWFAQLSPEARNVLANSGGEITITGRASGTGSRRVNERLARQRGEALSRFLRDEMGVQCRIAVRTRLEAPSNKDNAAARSATMKLGVSGSEAFIRSVPRQPAPVRPKRGSLQATPTHIAGLPKAVRAQYHKMTGGKEPTKPFMLGDYLILPNPDRTDGNRTQAIHRDNIPKGVGKLNGCWVQVSRGSIYAAAPYPQTIDAVKDRNPGLRNDPRMLRHRAAANRKLNDILQSAIKKGVHLRQGNHIHKTTLTVLRQVLVKWCGKAPASGI